jgi:putative transposase
LLPLEINRYVFALRQPGYIDDQLTDILRSGARRILAQATELEAETFLEAMKDLKLADGHDRPVRDADALNAPFTPVLVRSRFHE